MFEYFHSLTPQSKKVPFNWHAGMSCNIELFGMLHTPYLSSSHIRHFEGRCRSCRAGTYIQLFILHISLRRRTDVGDGENGGGVDGETVGVVC